MDNNYKFNNSIVNYVTSISNLKNLFESCKIENPHTMQIFYAIIYCHTMSILDAYIGEVIRYEVSYKEGMNAKKYEKTSFFNPQKASKSLKDVLGIDYVFDDCFSVATEKRNIIIHRNGLKGNGQRCIVKKIELQGLIEKVRFTVNDIHEKIIEKAAERCI